MFTPGIILNRGLLDCKMASRKFISFQTNGKLYYTINILNFGGGKDTAQAEFGHVVGIIRVPGIPEYFSDFLFWLSVKTQIKL